MAFSSNDYQQLGLMDSMLTLSERSRRILDESWAKDFGDRIFPKIEERPFAVLYKKGTGGPSAPVNVTVGALIIEEIFDMNDDDIVSAMTMDVRYQYALHTTSYVDQPLSASTLQRFRRRCANYLEETGEDLLADCISGIDRLLDEVLASHFPGKRLNAQRILRGITRTKENGTFDQTILQDVKRFQQNRLPVRADYVAYASESEYEARGTAPDDGTYGSSFRYSLNGNWRFSYAENPSAAVRGFESPSYDVSGWPEIRVPGHMQMQGYGSPAYVNYQYPWDGVEDLQPGQVPQHHNPTGSYVRFFTLPGRMQGHHVYISLRGVESAFALWLNGSYVGYSEDTFSPSDYDLTPYLVDGVNRLCVRVFMWSSGSWLEDQDYYRFAGIFRDVYLYSTPEVSVEDLTVRTSFDGDAENKETFERARLVIGTRMRADAEDDPETASASHIYGFTEYRLSLGGRVITSGTFDNEKENEVVETIAAPRLWSAEEPVLYDLALTIHGKSGEALEVVHQAVGFRRFEMRDGLMLLNGKRIVFKGVNRHEWTCDHGRAGQTEEIIRRDLALMKRNNINAIRTCHYPDDERLYRLCDEYGIYLIAEANMETHGSWAYREMGLGDSAKEAVNRATSLAESAAADSEPAARRSGVNTKEAGVIPGNNTQWQPALLDRVDSNYHRNKNHASILIWSCGNESHGGSVIYEMSREYRRLDPDRLVHYEGVFHDRTYHATSDMESQMYPSAAAIRQFLAENPDKPFICCEYSHSMGNSNGGIHAYTQLTVDEPRYQGGFIWDYVDQSIRTRDLYGEEFQAYGGDFLERPTDYSFSGDGIVAGDRMPYPKLQEIKYCYQNIEAVVSRDQVLVINRNLFVSTETLRCVAILARDGRVIAQEEIETGVLPGEQMAYLLPFDPVTEDGEYAVTVSFRLREDTVWAPAGYEVAFGQGVYRIDENGGAGDSEAAARAATQRSQFRVIRGTYNVGVIGEHYSAQVSLLYGALTSYKVGGRELIVQNPRVNMWRPLTDNDRGAHLAERCGQWRLASEYACAAPIDYKSQDAMERDRARLAGYPMIEEHSGHLDVCIKYLLPTTPASDVALTYRFTPDGTVHFLMDYVPPVVTAAGVPAPAGDVEDMHAEGDLAAREASDAHAAQALPPMPEFGMLLRFDPAYDRITWYGNGPDETYCDRDLGSRLGIYAQTVQEAMTRYLVPQECGNKTGVRWARLERADGHGMEFRAESPTYDHAASHSDAPGTCSMSFSALPYTPAEIEAALHHTELPRQHYTVVRCTLKQMGVGGDDSWGARPLPEYEIPADQRLRFAFSVRGY